MCISNYFAEAQSLTEAKENSTLVNIITRFHRSLILFHAEDNMAKCIYIIITRGDQYVLNVGTVVTS